jgi:hypothetical protein
MVINGSTGIFDELSLGDHFYFSTTILYSTLLKPDEAEHYATLVWSK